VTALGSAPTLHSRPDAEEPLANVLTTLVTGGLTLILHVSFLTSQVVGNAYHPVNVRVRLFAIAIVGIATLTLWIHRKTAGTALCAAAFVCIIAPFWLTFWISESNHALSGRFEQPFVGPKLLLFIISALCPTRPRWLGPALLIGLCAEMVGMWVALRFGSIPTVAWAGEPWVALTYALLAAFLFGSRLHWMQVHGELAVARAEAEMLQTTNEAFVAVQDLANTPLQSLEIALALMARERPNDSLLGSARRAVMRLRLLTERLPVKRFDGHWVDGSALETIRVLQGEGVARPETNGTTRASKPH
jgi:hypothetical protein